MQKKAISIMMCCIVFITLVAGCTGTQMNKSGDNNDKQAEPANQPKTTETSNEAHKEFEYDGTAPIAEEPLTISWICSNSGVSSGDMDFENMGWVQEILRLANVKLDMEILDPSAYTDSIKPRLAAGLDLPDVVQMPSSDADMAYINSGMFLDLTDLYDKYAINLSKRFEDNPTVKGQMTTYDGKIYYVPVINMSVDYVPNLLIQSQWLEKLDLQIPKTTDEFYDVLTAFKTQDPNGNGEGDEIPLFFAEYAYFIRMSSMWGLDLTSSLGLKANKNGELLCSFTSNEYKDFLEYWGKAYKEGLINSDFAGSNYDILYTHQSNDAVGSSMIFINFAERLSKLINPELDIENDSLIMIPMEPLKGPYGDQSYIGNDPVAGVFGISKDCKNPEVVFSFLDYLFSEEANNLLYYGIEGEDYKIIDSKIKVDLEKLSTDNYKERMGYNFGGFPRILLAAHRDVTYMQEIGEYNQKIRDYVYVADIINSYWLPEEIEVTQKYNTDLQTYLNEMLTLFIIGEADLSTFDDYVATAESMGLEELMKVYQARCDRMMSFK